MTSGIVCPRCGGGTDVLETRHAPRGIRRRRSCQSMLCGGKLTTYEEVASAAEVRRRSAVPEVRVPRELLEQLASLVYVEPIEAEAEEHDYLW